MDCKDGGIHMTDGIVPAATPAATPAVPPAATPAVPPVVPEGTPPVSTQVDKTYSAADIDRAVSKAIRTFEANQGDKFKELMAAEKAEAARLAKMTEQQRAADEITKQTDALAQREKALNTREMFTETQKQLVAEALPPEFASFLTAESAEQTTANLTTFKAKFAEAVAAAVDGRFKGKPPASGGSPGSTSWQQQFADAKAKGDTLGVISIKRQAAAEGIQL